MFLLCCCSSGDDGVLQMRYPDISLLLTLSLVFLFGVLVLVRATQLNNELDTLLVFLQRGVLQTEPLLVHLVHHVREEVEMSIVHQHPVPHTLEQRLLLPDPALVISHLGQTPGGDIEH